MNIAPAGKIGIALFTASLSTLAFGQTTSYTWQQIKDKFTATNPTLKASKLSIDESSAAEITAYLRPNPDFTLSADGVQVSRNGGVWRPLSGVVETPGVSYLHERQHKRELRRDQAKESTAIAESTYLDQQRSLLFSLQTAFASVLQAKAVLANAKENLSYWDHEIEINRTRFQAGDLAQVDVKRIQLQRAQFESDYETSTVNLRTAKIQLLTLLNERTPIERFDVTGKFDFTDALESLDEYRRIAVSARPDLKASVQNVDLAKITYRLSVANGSTDPTFNIWWSHNPSFSNPFANETIGGNISIPLRIFDRNQGEKARTRVDIGRNEQLRAANEALIYSDVDSAYYTLVENLNLLKPYKATYVTMATDIRDQMSFSYQNGGASLLDYLDSEKAYRDVRLAYLNLIGAYLTTVAQMNMAAGKEVVQ